MRSKVITCSIFSLSLSPAVYRLTSPPNNRLFSTICWRYYSSPCTPLLLLGCRDAVLRPLLHCPPCEPLYAPHEFIDLLIALQSDPSSSLTRPRSAASIAGSEQLYLLRSCYIFSFYFELVVSTRIAGRNWCNMSYPVQMLYAFSMGSQ